MYTCKLCRHSYGKSWLLVYGVESTSAPVSTAIPTCMGLLEAQMLTRLVGVTEEWLQVQDTTLTA